MDLAKLIEVVKAHPDRDRRSDALYELMKYGATSEVEEVLKDRVANDHFWRARAISIRLLADLFGTEQAITKLISQVPESDVDSRARSTAIEIISEIWIGDKRELEKLLKKWITLSPYPDVRYQSLVGLCEKNRDEDFVLPILLDRAENDPDPIVRLTAIESLVRDWREIPEVYTFIVNRAKEDEDPDVVRAANKVALPKVLVFFSYSHKDKKFAKYVIDYIQKELKRDRIEIWWDELITTGKLWDNSIRTKIRESQIGLVLVSQSFINSEYCQKVEVRNFLKKRRSDGMVIFPIILEMCVWQNHNWLSATQCLPRGGKNLKSHYNSPAKRAELLYLVLLHLQQVANEIRLSQQ